ncbi:MAG: hypothetical protein ACRDV3_10370 [Acidothermaceae bacterium]
MKHIGRLFAVLIAAGTTVLATLLGFVATANAMPLPLPPAGPLAPATSSIAEAGSGLAVWQLALIAAGAAALLVAVTIAATLLATHARRPIAARA